MRACVRACVCMCMCEDISSTHAKKKRSEAARGADPPEGNVNVQMLQVWLKVHFHLSSFREHPFDTELGVFLHSPRQLAHKTRDD